MAKITKSKRGSGERETISVKTQKSNPSGVKKWWKGSTQQERAMWALDSAAYLKETQQYRWRQAAMYSRMYSNIPIFGFMGGNMARMTSNSQLPYDRPTMNVVQSCVDTLVSRVTQARPRPVFLTDNGDYKKRNLAKKLNDFLAGEFHQTDAYQLGKEVLRDAAAWAGTGVIKVFKGIDHKVKLERALYSNLYVDPNDAWMGKPRQMFELQLIDRSVLMEAFTESRSRVEKAEQAYPDNNADASKTVSDMVMVVEAWHLPSGPDAGDGFHLITCSAGPLFEEKWDKEYFPFVMMDYNPRIVGYWGQSLAEQLMGTQMEINKLLVTITRSINLVGVPRVFVEDGSKVVKAHLNDQVGSIVTYRGTKPEYSVAPCVPQEIYAQLQRLIDYAYQQSGISALAATAKKPDGLNSGAALREYDDLQTDRFAELVKRYDNMFIDLAYQIIDCAREIAEEEDSYQTVYPNKDGTKEVDLPAADIIDNPFVIQCFDSSALPRDPAGRIQTLTDWLQAGAIDIKEFRRLQELPDLQQKQKLDSASEERIFQCLDDIVERGKYTPPDPFMDLESAKELSVKYYNLYVSAKLEEDRAEMLRTFNSQAIALQQAAQPPPQPMAAAPGPAQAQPEALPVTQMLPRAV